jgi:Tol biopolymer transport system component
MRVFRACCCVVAASIAGQWALAAGIAAPETVLEWPGHRMFEDFSARSELSPDGRWILRTFVDGNQALLAMPSGKDQSKRLADGLKDFERAAWCGNALVRVGTGAAGRAWYAGEKKARHAIAVPPDAMPVCNITGMALAHYTSYAARAEVEPPKAIFVGAPASQSEIKVAGVVMVARFSPDASKLYAVVRQDNGASSLLEISTTTKRVAFLAKDMDAWPFPGPELAVTPDGKSLILPLAGLTPPDNARRQLPAAPERWLKLYRFDLGSRQFSLLREKVRSDQTDPAVVGDQLFWVSGFTTKEVVALPVAGGPLHTVVAGKDAYLPTWSPGGKRLAFVTGDYRLADWALPQDIDIVDITPDAITQGTPTPYIVGNHEDFPPQWSPDGRWIAWHSHRAVNNPAYYDAPGTSDDIWIRRADDVHAPEIRATHDLWETYGAFWSPDGRQLIYTTWDRNGAPGVYEVRVTSFNPETGQVLGEKKFPMPKAVHSPEIAVWSPDGQEVAVTDAVSRTDRVLWIVSKDGAKLSKVVAYPSETYGSVSWTPDGKTLIFAGYDGRHMQIYSVARGGGTPQKLTDGTGNVLNPVVSPNGKWIACSHLETTETVLRAQLQ